MRGEIAPFLASHDAVLLFDGECMLCNRLMRMLIKADPDARIKLATVQSPVGQALLQHLSLPTQQFDTIVFIVDGQVRLRSDAFLAAIALLSAPYRLLAVFRFFPRPVRNALYDLIAGNRYRWFGQSQHCSLPTADHQQRYLSAVHIPAPLPPIEPK